MDWIAASALMFCFSILMYLAVRKSTLLKTPTQINNLAMFAIPMVFFAAMALISKDSIILTLSQYTLLIVSAVFFSYLGNVFSLKSMECAPNPGYSLIISKSYVVLTSVSSIFLFGAEFTPKSALAIVMVIAFSSLIFIDKQADKRRKYKPSWLPLTLGAFFCWALLALSAKYLLEMGVSIPVRLLYVSAIVSALILGEIRLQRIKQVKLSTPQLLLLGIIGIFAAGFNYFMNLGYELAPNLGYVNLANAASISALTVFSAILFKDELTVRKIIGVLGVTAGLALLFI
jgi:drug/metabolite transporter (DMT)-like permease